MKITLPSRFIGTFTAVAIAATTLTAAPAYADRDNDRAARAIAAILGLAVVGAIINDNKRDRADDHVPARRPSTGTNHGRYEPRPLPRRVERAPLPSQCFRRFQTRRGQVKMFVRRCLERNYRAVNRLPQYCAQRIRTDRGVRAGFDARCLRRAGYRVARH